jgi:hypothetical protein
LAAEVVVEVAVEGTVFAATVTEVLVDVGSVTGTAMTLAEAEAEAEAEG